VVAPRHPLGGLRHLGLKFLAEPGDEGLKDSLPLLLHAVHPADLLGQAALVALEVLLKGLEGAVEAVIEGGKPITGLAEGGEGIPPCDHARSQQRIG